MTILNKNYFPKLTTYYPGNPNNNIKWFYKTGANRPYFKLFPWDTLAKDYWYIEILNGDAFIDYPLHTLMPTNVLNQIKSKDIGLIICNMQEPYHSVVEELYKDVIIPNNIDPTNIILLSNSSEISREIIAVSEKYNLPVMNSLTMYEWEFAANQAAYYLDNIDPDQTKIARNTLSKTVYDKKFLCLNGYSRPHRTAIIALLNIYNLINQGYVSFNTNLRGQQPPNGDEIFKQLITDFTQDSELYNIFSSNSDIIKKLEPLYLDTKPDESNTLLEFTDSDPKFYVDTYFTIVTETACLYKYSHPGLTPPGRNLSEKTFKPILNKHPFIIIGLKHSIKLLQERGFKTFHPLIDESYDNEDDDGKRILMAFKQVIKLANLQPNVLKGYLTYFRSITEYNFNRLQDVNKQVKYFTPYFPNI